MELGGLGYEPKIKGLEQAVRDSAALAPLPESGAIDRLVSDTDAPAAVRPGSLSKKEKPEHRKHDEEQLAGAESQAVYEESTKSFNSSVYAVMQQSRGAPIAEPAGYPGAERGHEKELFSYAELKNYTRNTVMNAIMHGEHNAVKPEEKERYQMWATLSGFNFLLSTLMYDKFWMFN